MGFFYALLSAAIWSGADLTGGVAARKLSALQGLSLNSLAGFVFTLVLALVFGQTWPNWQTAAWAALAGSTGALGLLAYYRGLRRSTGAVVVPTAAVVGVLLPVVIGLLRDGLPAPDVLVGFLAGLIGIACVTRGHAGTVAHARQGLFYGVLGGIGFGMFLVFIALAGSQALFGTLVLSKLSGLAVSLVMLRSQGLTWPRRNQSRAGLFAGLLTGLLDVGGNVFYVMATMLTRLDSAAVLASLSPALAVLWYRLFLKEHVTRMQIAGVAFSLLAVVLIG